LFVGGWITAGLLRPGYSPVHEAISQLARLGAPNRLLMTAAFVGFGVTVPMFAPVVSGALGAGKPLTAALALAGVATLGVAAVPLSRSGGGTRDLIHGALATTTYVGMALSPLLGAAAFYRRHNPGGATASALLGLIAAGSLAATPFVTDVGLYQRLGLGVVDTWILVMAVSILRGALA
jgi:hypothetical membrane protein